MQQLNDLEISNQKVASTLYVDKNEACYSLYCIIYNRS